MIEIRHNAIAPGAVLVTVAGKLMIGAEGGQLVKLAEELLSEGKRLLIFDLTAVTAIDSTGIGLFISIFNKVAAGGGQMRLAGATGRVFEAFRVSLLDRVFQFYPSVEKASIIA